LPKKSLKRRSSVAKEISQKTKQCCQRNLSKDEVVLPKKSLKIRSSVANGYIATLYRSL